MSPSLATLRRRPGFFMIALAVAISVLVPTAAFAAKPAAPPPVTIQILNVSDWHGNVDPVSNFGGAWNISARWQQDRLLHPTLTLTAGDDFGATPALSGFFNEEPAVKAQRMMGIQVGGLGNHNFDRGLAHLQQMINLAGAPTSADAPGQPFRYVSANLKNLAGNLSGVDPVAYFNVGGAKIAVIGITNEEAPGLVLPGSFGPLQVTDSVAAANKYARIARKAKADAVVVITHKGLTGFNSGAPVGPLIDFAEDLEPGLVDVVFGDHTDIQYSGEHNGILVHENRSYGVGYARTTLEIQPGAPGKAGNVIDKEVEFVSPSDAGSLGNNRTSCTGGTPPTTFCDQAIVDMLVPYRTQLNALLDGRLAKSTLPFKNGGPSTPPGSPAIQRSGETPLGDLLADGMRWRYGTDIAMMNGGGIRSQLPACSYQPTNAALNRANYSVVDHTTLTTCAGYGSGSPQDIVLGDVFTVLPFGNILNTRTVTGAQIWLAMEQGVSRINSTTGLGSDGRFPQISGFKFGFRYDVASTCLTAAACTINENSRVQWIELDNGTEVLNDNSQTFTMALPNFVNLGGDGYFMFADGKGATQELDANVLTAYIESLGATPDTRLLDPSSYPPNTRIVKCSSGDCPAP